MRLPTRELRIAYCITQRGQHKFWTRIGVSFVNRDGSISVKLEAIPVSGQIVIRDHVPSCEVAVSEVKGPTNG